MCLHLYYQNFLPSTTHLKTKVEEVFVIEYALATPHLARSANYTAVLCIAGQIHGPQGPYAWRMRIGGDSILMVGRRRLSGQWFE